MTTISNLIRRAANLMPAEMEVKYVYPTLYVVFSSDRFTGADNEARDRILADRLDLAVSDLIHLRSYGVVDLVLCTPREREDLDFLDTEDPGQHWLQWFNPLFWSKDSTDLPAARPTYSGVKAVHFYGYKGGQGRTTVLALLAKRLAQTGQRVLVVDADVEAPSLDAIFDVAAEFPEATLMGLCGWAETIEPIPRAFVGHPAAGIVDVLACRPRSSTYDMDFAAFILGTALDAKTLQRAIQKMAAFVAPANGSPKYDIVLFDHRTGLTPSVLPIMQAWPGPALLFVRPDAMSRPAEMSSIFKTLLFQNGDIPGAFVSFSLDPKEGQTEARQAHARFVDQLLSTISDALTRGSDEDIDPSELEDYWVLWPYDRALIDKARPTPQDLSVPNLSVLDNLIDLLDLQRPAIPRTAERTTLPRLTISGATDEGWFILTPEIARLFGEGSSIRYVFGRKGTGKTRLLRELHAKQLGEPLLVAADYKHGGLPSAGTTFSKLYEACEKNPDRFWWSLLRIALNTPNTTNLNLLEQIERTSISGSDTPAHLITESEKLLGGVQVARVFLIDGVETAVPAPELRVFVESLFRFMAAVQYNRHISNKLTIRLFLRSDLWQGASQNVEQQVEGVSTILRWDKTSVLNFALGRMASLKWFQANFNETCAKVESEKARVETGSLTEEEAEDLLLQVFPKSLDRNKLKTTTFFSTYFSDAGVDTESKASFYPRLFDAFLRGIDNFAATFPSGPTSEDGKLRSALVLKAYDDASGKFINEVRHELYTLLVLDEEPSANRSAVDLFIQSFAGQKTPFKVEELISMLSTATSIDADKIRESLHRMKAMGIFEDSPSLRGEWRTGRLYKSGLKMKYVRSSTDSKVPA